MKYLVLLLLALPVHAETMTEQGKGYRVELKAGVPASFSFVTKRGCSIFKFAGTAGTSQANVTISSGAKSAAGPATAVRSVVNEASGSQTGVVTASADTVVQVLFYDYAPRTRVVGGRNGVSVTSCFA